ncbi:MAG TPA: ATP cone domain-containing protein [Chitinophagaceae bacterium]|nr:hypothetical protein [Chitinophagaceae bacterium]MCB9054359.1 ATPase [Chitinophagales bacterium]HPG11980.1 ATP cone domain-containing protein [Chitinophagaceae bacterium]HRX95180.1 ATP cone domain-containing protein [Chitinophagaceae bacterium]
MKKKPAVENISIVKADGTVVPFNAQKIRQSLVRSGATSETIDQVIRNVESRLYQNISTKKLYKIVFSELRKKHPPSAGKYHLKRAIMELGPTGFPFEKYISEVFKAEGYKTQTGKIIMGNCVKHEVDVIAENDAELSMMECKFHGEPGTVCDVKHTLYVSARFQDIERKINVNKPGSKKFKGWLVTNTRMTSDAEQYGICSGLELMSWNFPKGKSLREKINDTGLHPVTCITSLSRAEKNLLLERMVVMCKSLCANPAMLAEIGITQVRTGRILEEAKNICNTKINTK